MLAIEVKYLGKTSRWQLKSAAGILYFPISHDIRPEADMLNCVQAYAKIFEWDGRDWAGGSTNTGYVFVQNP